ncbi:hypothetical protein GOP47_0007271, partial [Adiantum capillus-veneris]
MADSQTTQGARFPLGQHVEVLQTNQALRGSWQIATIVMVKNGRREVEYNQIFQSDGLLKVKESFSVTKDLKMAIGKRGFLRPLGPKVTSRIWTKGLLVDAYNKGAWWEGVVLEDTKNAEVKVLFPDRKEESVVHSKLLRVSHQWDEFTGEWEARGYWKGFCVSGGKDTSYQEVKDLDLYMPHKRLTCHNQLHHVENLEDCASPCPKDTRKLVQAKMRAAREFLFDIGYTLEFHQRIGRGREAVYIAPHGRRFYSLTMACKALKKKHSLPCNIEACKSKAERLLCIYDFSSLSCLESSQKDSKGLKAIVNYADVVPIAAHENDKLNVLCIEGGCRRGRKRRLSATTIISSVDNAVTTGIINRTPEGMVGSRASVSRESQLVTVSKFKKAYNRQGCLQDSQAIQTARPLCNKDKQRCGRKHGLNTMAELSSGYNAATTSTTNRNKSIGRVGRRACRALVLREPQSVTSLQIEETNRPKISFLPALDTPLRKQGKKASINHDSVSPTSTSSSVVTEVNLQVVKNDKADEICSACGDGGDLLLCDYCPSTYHAECVGLQVIPEGNWYCFGCCCASCEEFLFEREDCGLPLTCKQCEKKYHVNCSPSEGCHDIPKNNWFCGVSCEQLYKGLCRQLGNSYPLEAGGLSWMLLKSNQQEGCLNKESKLSMAHVVLQECFVPIIDVCTGVDIISQTLFSQGSAMTRLNCPGFYTLILERGCELISVATVRIHGSRLAEMPFIGTRFRHRRKGMCRQLMGVLEKMLHELGVRKLLLPAVPQLLNTWKQKFGFQHINSWDRFEMRQMNVMRFPGTFILKKNVVQLRLEPHGFFSLSTQVINPSGPSPGCREEFRRRKRSRFKTQRQDLEVGDTKVLVATTKYNRMVISPKWYVDSMKDLSNDAKLLQERRSKPSRKNQTMTKLVAKNKRRRQTKHGTIAFRSRLKSSTPADGNPDQ